MNVAILGVSAPSSIIKNVIEKLYNPMIEERGNEKLDVVAYVINQNQNGMGGGYSSCVDNLPVIDFMQFQSFYHNRVITKLVMPREFLIGQAPFLSQLRMMNVNLQDLYLMDRIENGISQSIAPYLAAKYFPYLEFHVADHCNLNCKGCEHYSGLVKTPHFHDVDRLTQDMEQLHKFIDDIGVIRILGGEPLLHPNINKFVELSRRLYPKAMIFVVTNALLLPSMPDSFFETLRQQRTAIHISYYKPLASKIQSIRHLLDKNGIRYDIAPTPVEKFTIKQTLKRHDHPWQSFLNCFQAHCYNLYEGKVAACFLPFTTKYFNDYFNKQLPEDGAIDLYDPNLTTETLKMRIMQPFERCRYCTMPVEVAVDWTTIKNPSVLSDWTNDNLIQNA